MALTKTDYHITLADLRTARKAYEAHSPRDLFYRAATQLVDLALSGNGDLRVAESLAIILQTWNVSYYRFTKKFDSGHFTAIERLIKKHRPKLAGLRVKRIEDLAMPPMRDSDQVYVLFDAFEKVLGPVGASKSLHLLAPSFFPLLDRKIASAYGVPLGKFPNSENYWAFMLATSGQCRDLIKQGFRGNNLLKAIDEFNVCKYVRQWI